MPSNRKSSASATERQRVESVRTGRLRTVWLVEDTLRASEDTTSPMAAKLYAAAEAARAIVLPESVRV